MSMASNPLKLPLLQSIKLPNPSTPFPQTNTNLFPSSQIPFHHHQQQQNQHSQISFSHQNLIKNYSKTILSLSPKSSSLSSYSPPTSKEEAILQAKICLSTTLEKPLNNPRLTGKLKKQKQPKLRIEIPVIDDSPESLTQLAFQIFGSLPITRKAAKSIKILLLWPNPSLTDLASKAFSSNPVENMDLSSVSNDSTRLFLNNPADVAVFMAPEASNLEAVMRVCDGMYPKPVVIFNPKWVFEEESEFGELSSFVGSFEVIYSFMGLEVRGILNKKRGMVFKCVRDGVLSGEKWEVMVEEEGEFKVVSRFKKRPSIGEVENVLYNLMAVNSPITKSAKFLRDLVSSVTGKK